MSVEIRVPTLGESVTEATIGQWFKKVGETVAADEPVVELETDKVTIEVPAPSAGVLETISANPGDTVNVGALIGAIGAAGAVVTPKAEAKPAAAAPAPAANGNASAAVSPSAAKLMEENGLSAANVEGSGKRGTILKEDVAAAIAKPAASAPVAAPEPKAAPAPAPVARAPEPAPALPRRRRPALRSPPRTIAAKNACA